MDSINYAGIEVSSGELLVRFKDRRGVCSQKTYKNHKRGHTALVKDMTFDGHRTRVVLEATGVYSLDLAIHLSQHPEIEIMVLNPLKSHHFSKVHCGRSKNDKVDARMLLEYVERMGFTPFNPPSENLYALKAIARKITSINDQCTRQKNQKHASSSTKTTPKEIIKSTKAIIRTCKREIEKLSESAMFLIEADGELKRKYGLLNTIPGIAKASSIQILGEMAFYDSHLKPKSLVGLAGLDPLESQSGKSGVARKGISRRGSQNFRRSLYMPAVVAKRCNPAVKAFSDHLLDKGKKPKQVTCAIMRKLIHSISGMFRSDTPWDGNKFFKMN